MDSSARTAVILDQHPLWLDAIEPVLVQSGVRVVGRTTVPEQALALVEEQEPDLLLAEIRTASQELDGVTLLRRARECVPSLKTIVLSSSADSADVGAALDAGAVAYVLKTAQPEDIASAVRQAFEHSIFFAKPRLVAAARRPQPPAVQPARRLRHGLTRRELEILRVVAEGHSNTELARMLWVTEQTVKFHLSNIYRKLGVSNRTEASRWAQLNGLLAAPEEAASAA